MERPMADPPCPAGTPRQEWATRREHGSVPLLRLMVWLALRLGRAPARLLLYPICAYFLAFAADSRAASRDYLRRVLEHPPSWLDRWRHFLAFGACVLDRVFLLNDRTDLFDISIQGGEVVRELLKPGKGCLLFGAHLGSFEVLRAMARREGDLRVSLVMYQDNARKTNAALNAINPVLEMEIIALGESGSMLAVASRLDEGHIVGLLADRGLDEQSMAPLPFLGAPARFPVGPFRMAALLRRPVVLMLGLYRGGNRYDIVFEQIAAPEDFSDGATGPAIERMMRRYVERLAFHCREAPYNWFNFYRFWG